MNNLEMTVYYSSKKHNGMIINGGCFEKVESVKERLEQIKEDVISLVVINRGNTIARGNVSGMVDTNWL